MVKVRVKVGVPVQNEVGGTSILNRGQFCSLLILFVDGTASQQVGVAVVVAVVVTVVVVAVIVVVIVIVVMSRR